MSLQFLLLFGAEADTTDVAFAIGKRFHDAREIPLVPRRIFGDENDVADGDVAAVAGPFPALLQRRNILAAPPPPKGINEVPNMAP